MKDIKISIIVPIYKVEKYIEECLRTLEAQTYSNIEVLLIDDGSPDNCGRICDEFAEGKEKFTVIHQENAGVSVARNNGIEHATGDYILFVDPDDYLIEDCCEKMAQVIEENDYNVVFFRDRDINEFTGETIEREAGESALLTKEDIEFLQYNNIDMNYRARGIHSGTPWGKLFKKSFLDEHKLRFTPGVVKAQDVLFDCQVYEQLESAYYLDYVGYVYRINEGSSNVRYNPKIVKGTYLLIEGLGKIADCHEGNENYQKAMAHNSMDRINFIERLYLFNKSGKVRKKEAMKIYDEYLNLPTVKKYIGYYDVSMAKSISEKIRCILINANAISLYYDLLYIRYLA